MVPVGNVQLEDKIFPGTPGDSLLYTSKELDMLKQLGIRLPSMSLWKNQQRHSNLLAALWKQTALLAEMGNHLKPQAPQPESPHTQSTAHLLRNTMNPTPRTCTAPHSSTGRSPKRTRKIACLHSNIQHLQHRNPSLHEQRKCPHLEDSPQVFCVSSQSHRLSKLDEYLSVARLML